LVFNTNARQAGTIEDGYKVYETLLDEFYDEMMPITSHKPALGSLAHDESHAASRRTDNLCLARAAAGRIDAVDMARA